MSLETRNPRRIADVTRDKPQVDRAEHANYERAVAQRHPAARASHLPTPDKGWARHLDAGSGWR